MMDKEFMRQQALQMLLGNQMPGVAFGAPVTPQSTLPQMPGAMTDRDAAMMQNAVPQMSQETPESVIGRLFQGVDPMSPQADTIREQMMQRYRMGR